MPKYNKEYAIIIFSIAYTFTRNLKPFLFVSLTAYTTNDRTKINNNLLNS